MVHRDGNHDFALTTLGEPADRRGDGSPPRRGAGLPASRRRSPLGLALCLIAVVALMPSCLAPPQGSPVLGGGGDGADRGSEEAEEDRESTSSSGPEQTPTTTTTTAAPTTAAPTTTGRSSTTPSTTTTSTSPSTTTSPTAPPTGGSRGSGGGTPTADGFVHPGIGATSGQLRTVKEMIAAGRQPWTSALSKVYKSGSSRRTDRRSSAYRYSSLQYVPAPTSVIRAAGNNSTAYINSRPERNLEPVGGVEHLDDARAAYTHALLWWLTDDAAHASKAIEILDAWSATLREIAFDEPRRSDTGGQVWDQGKLQAAWGGSLFTRAAELIRHSNAGWSRASAERFGQMLDEVYLPLVITGWSNGANWLMSFAEATIAIGVYNGDRQTFDAGVAYWRAKAPTTVYLPSDGSRPIAPDPWFDTDSRMRKLWYGPSRYIAGLQAETLRDLSHSMMGLGAMVNAAETAYLQGVDLYAEQQDRIVAGFERNAAYVNEYLDVVASRGGRAPSSSWVPSNWVGSDFDLGGTAYLAGWEVAHHHYREVGVSMPNTAQLVPRLRPSGTAMHLSWETLTHGR